MEEVRIATRESKLAMIQANKFGNLLESKGFTVRYVTVKSSGDIDTGKPLYEVGKVGIFTSELNELLISGEADFAVHSAKDLPSELEENIEISLFMDREDYRDFFVSNIEMEKFSGFIGTSSKRRELFLKYSMGFSKFKLIRGNIDTRIRKFMNREYDAIVVAKVALDRLKIKAPGEIISDSIIPPAPNQGIIAVTSLKGTRFSNIAKKFQRYETLWEATQERKLMEYLELGCHNAISIKADFPMRITRFSYTDGHKRFDHSIHGDVSMEDVKIIRENIW